MVTGTGISPTTQHHLGATIAHTLSPTGFPMAGRFDDHDTFIAAVQPIIDRQLEIYNENPKAYVRELPNRILSHFLEPPSESYNRPRLPPR
jgi:hypothetical protein